jgi:hypothetical protein
MSPLADQMPTTAYQNSQKNIGEFLKAWLKSRWLHGHLELLIRDGAEYSIIGGYWVHPHAPGIRQNPEESRISCIMIDVTWSVIREAVTAMLVAVSKNMAIPLALAFRQLKIPTSMRCFGQYSRPNSVSTCLLCARV